MTMTFAMIYPVDTHEISSSVAPRFPIMCGIATFTIDVSMSSSTAASVTAMAMRYLYLYLSSAVALADATLMRAVLRAPAAMMAVPSAILLRCDVCEHRHARTQWVILAASFRDLDPRRNALHHLREVARGVVGR